MNLKKLGKNLKENVLMSNYTTMKVGGPAKYFYVAESISDLLNALTVSEEEKIPYVVIGGGSNIIVKDKGFDGLVILNRTKNIAFIPEKAQAIIDSGVSLSRIIMEAANRDLGGLESLFGIPGTIGGAVYGNAGAQKLEIISFIRSVTLFHENKIIRVKPEWLNASYRNSRLKMLKQSGKPCPIILTVKIQLSHHKKEEILRKLHTVMLERETKQPYDKPSAGSIFKNIGHEKEKTAGYILEQVGAKKIKINGAEVSKKHANFVINTKSASSDDIIKVIENMKTLAHDNYGVELEEEIEYI